jgi:hypothetical protein
MDDQHRQRPGDEADRHHLNGEGMKMTDELRPEVAAHLAEDAASPEELHELQATLALLGALPQVAPRRTFIITPEQVAETTRRRTPRRFAWVWPTRWATALAAVCFALTVGLGQGTTPAPPAAAPSPTVAVAAATATTAPSLIDPSTGLPYIQAAAGPGTPIVDPVPTAVPIQAPAQASSDATRIDWRPAQIVLGSLTALGAFCGFLLPPFLRRRDTATA